jgi:hypothetical protein
MPPWSFGKPLLNQLILKIYFWPLSPLQTFQINIARLLLMPPYAPIRAAADLCVAARQPSGRPLQRIGMIRSAARQAAA